MLMKLGFLFRPVPEDKASLFLVTVDELQNMYPYIPKASQPTAQLPLLGEPAMSVQRCIPRAQYSCGLLDFGRRNSTCGEKTRCFPETRPLALNPEDVHIWLCCPPYTACSRTVFYRESWWGFIKYRPFPFYLSVHWTDLDDSIGLTVRRPPRRDSWRRMNAYIHAAMNSYTDEMRYWRNLAMQRGHERLDPSYVNGDKRHIRKRSRTLHPTHAFSPYIPRAQTSHGPRGDRPHPRSVTPNRAHFPRPIVPSEERVTPAIPFRIQFIRYFNLPSITNCPLYQQQRHSSHTPVYSQSMIRSRRPLAQSSPTSHPSSMKVFGPIQNQWYLITVHNGVRRLPLTPRGPASTHPSPAPTPELYAFRTSYVPAAEWTGNTELDKNLGQPLPDPYTAPSAISLEASVTLGTIRCRYISRDGVLELGLHCRGHTDVPVRPAPWLIPNPVNPGVLQLEWGRELHPTTARRITGVVVLCDVALVNQLWEPIVIEQSGRRVTTHLTRAEVEHISLGEDNYLFTSGRLQKQDDTETVRSVERFGMEGRHEEGGLSWRWEVGVGNVAVKFGTREFRAPEYVTSAFTGDPGMCRRS
ncbi:hypothetical protein EV401DRAFT_2199948 [Pisolithus croceorrhizus]|nr:hypothetical protein EV401DRAFT_2202667 [Pisolithus croceorrhizus]KAI6107876.1 hypothetical protein EV401DRAFT_2199994 [Pisolithus croceorrhizus]KAI6108557.1 hypothetical protein EV401DRAFT_2199948 [Pisolithus croceorrhizus]